MLAPRRRGGRASLDTFLNDPFFRDADLITSSFLDSMIPKDTVSNMNQFDFLVDIVEKKDKFHLSGELPGCSVANVDVKVDKENNLHISAMKSIKHEEDEQSPDGTVKWHAIERSSGKVERIFALPEAADADKIDCSMKDGVLSIDIMKKPEFIGEPKKLEEKEMKKIPIKGA
jgi:HSP20 family molecular chaperone IbpA